MRISRPIKLGAALVAASLPYFSVAEICEAEYPEYLVVYKPEDLEIIGHDCTTIIGDLGFNDTWSGPFILPGVENVTGTIRVERWQQGRVRQPNVTRVEFPDLKVEVPVLKRADYLDICSFGNNCGIGADEGPDLSIIDPLKITLPALESVGELIIGGRTASISAPKLTNVSESARFQLPESAASLDFPELDHVGHSFAVEGAISSIHIPSQRNTTASVKVSSTIPLNISLPLAGNPRFLGFFGEIEGLSLLNLADFQRLQIHSDLPLDCGPLDDQFEPIVAEIVDTEWARDGRYRCNSTASNGGSSVVKPVFAGVVAAGIGAGLVLW